MKWIIIINETQLRIKQRIQIRLELHTASVQRDETVFTVLHESLMNATQLVRSINVWCTQHRLRTRSIHWNQFLVIRLTCRGEARLVASFLGSLVRLETAGGNEERKRENGEEEEGGYKGKHRTCRGIASRMLPTWLSRSSIDTYRLVSPLCTTCTHDAWRNVDVSTGRVHDSTEPLTCSCVFQFSLVSSFMLPSSYMNMTHLWKLRFKSQASAFLRSIIVTRNITWTLWG